MIYERLKETKYTNEFIAVSDLEHQLHEAREAVYRGLDHLGNSSNDILYLYKTEPNTGRERLSGIRIGIENVCYELLREECAALARIKELEPYIMPAILLTKQERQAIIESSGQTSPLVEFLEGIPPLRANRATIQFQKRLLQVAIFNDLTYDRSAEVIDSAISMSNSLKRALTATRKPHSFETDENFRKAVLSQVNILMENLELVSPDDFNETWEEKNEKRKREEAISLFDSHLWRLGVGGEDRQQLINVFTRLDRTDKSYVLQDTSSSWYTALVLARYLGTPLNTNVEQQAKIFRETVTSL